MAGSKISALAALTALADGDVLPIVDVSAGATKKVTTDTLADYVGPKVLPFTKVTDFGAVGDGVTNDTTSIQNAINGTAPGGVCYFPEGRWLFSTLTVTKSITLLGAGWEHRTAAAFGDALYLDTSRTSGTILLSTTTGGTAITFSAGGGFTRRPVVKHLALVGPGSGTSLGMQIGVNASGSGVSQAFFQDVLVANFANGAELDNCYDGTFVGFRFRGCPTSLNLENCNQNEFYNTEFQYSSVYAVLGTTNAAMNCFYGGLIQNCSGTAGMSFSGEANHVYGFYCENASPPTDIFVLNATGVTLHDCRIGSGSNGITVGTNARSCLLQSCRGAGTTPIALTGNAQGTTLINMDRGFVVTDSAPLSSNTTYIENGRVRAKTFEGIGPLLVGKTGEYWSPSCTRTASAMTAGTVYAMPVIAAMSRPIVRIGVEVTIVGGAGCTITLGIYNDDELGVPSTLFLDAGTIDGNTVAAQEITINVTPLVGKVYHLAAMAIGGSPTVRVLGTTNPPPWMGCHLTLANATATNVFRVSRTRTGIGTAALPDPLAATSLSGTMPLIALRF